MDVLISEAIGYSVEQLGYERIRSQQKEVLEHLLQGEDSLLVAPTGHGKSFVFEAMPFAMSYIQEKQLGQSDTPKIVLVISPLISLMKTQATDLRNRGISAAYLQVSTYINP
jgi:ATP-dependent DNA helicase RecQ